MRIFRSPSAEGDQSGGLVTQIPFYAIYARAGLGLELADHFRVRGQDFEFDRILGGRFQRKVEKSLTATGKAVRRAGFKKNRGRIGISLGELLEGGNVVKDIKSATVG